MVYIIIIIMFYALEEAEDRECLLWCQLQSYAKLTRMFFRLYVVKDDLLYITKYSTDMNINKIT